MDLDHDLVLLIDDKVREKHISNLKNIIENNEDASAAFAVRLLRNYSKRPDINNFLKQRWNSAGIYLRNHLLWRILDYPDLPIYWHEKLFQFILSEWESFKNEQLLFWGCSQNIIWTYLSIKDECFPKSKDWAYLCCLPEIAQNKEVAQAIISLKTQDENEFTCKVAKKLLEKFYKNDFIKVEDCKKIFENFTYTCNNGAGSQRLGEYSESLFKAFFEQRKN